MKAARIREYKKPLVFEDIPIPGIQADEVLVNVQACGMCRSDVLLVDGFFQNYANIAPPVIIAFDQINEHLDKLPAGDIVGRAVVSVGSAAGRLTAQHA